MLSAKPNLTRIILRGGLGDLRFGMLRDEVRAMLGEPDDVVNDLFTYDEIDLHLEFSAVHAVHPAEPRLTEIWTETSFNRTLLGFPLLEMSLNDARAALERNGIKHEHFRRCDGHDENEFEHGLRIENLYQKIERIVWTNLDSEFNESTEEPVG